MNRALRDQRRTRKAKSKAPAARRPAPLAPWVRRAVFCVLACASVGVGIHTRDAVFEGLAGRLPAHFAIERIAVVGLDTIPDDALRELVAAGAGTPLGALDPGTIEARLVSHPRIANAAVSTVIPGRLLIWGAERRPVARVRSGELLLWVDEGGTPFARREDEERGEGALPLLVPRSQPSAGIRSAVLASALGSLAQLRAAGFAVAEWHERGLGAESDSPVVHLEGAMAPLVLGSGDRVLQMRRLARALALGELREAGAIDLRFRDQVIFWPAAPDVVAAGKRVSPGG